MTTQRKDSGKTSNWKERRKRTTRKDEQKIRFGYQQDDAASFSSRRHLVLCLRFVSLLVGHLLQEVPAVFANLWIAS